MIPSDVLRSGEVLLISLIRPQSSVALFVGFAFVQFCRSQLDNLHLLMRFKGQSQCPPFVLNSLREAHFLFVLHAKRKSTYNFSLLAAFVPSSRGMKVVLIDMQIIFSSLGMLVLKEGKPFLNKSAMIG